MTIAIMAKEEFRQNLAKLLFKVTLDFMSTRHFYLDYLLLEQRHTKIS